MFTARTLDSHHLQLPPHFHQLFLLLRATGVAPSEIDHILQQEVDRYLVQSTPSYSPLPTFASSVSDPTVEFFSDASDSHDESAACHSSRFLPIRQPPFIISTPYFHPPYEDDYLLAQSSRSLQIPQLFPLTLSSAATASHCANSARPAGSEKRMFPTPILSSRDLRDDPLSLELYLQNRALDAGSVPSHHSVPPPHNDGCQWIELLQSSPIPQMFPLTLGSTVTKSPCSNAACSHSSKPLHSSHHFHPQHERDYVLAKSISSSLSGGPRVSALSYHTSQYTEVDSVWPEGPTAWLSEPLPPRSRPFLLDDDVLASPEPQCSSMQDLGIKIIFPSATDMISPATAPIHSCLIGSVCPSSSRRRHIKNPISSPRNSYPSSPLLFCPPPQPSLQFSFCAILSALLSLLWFILTPARIRFSMDSRDTVQDLHPVRQLWHIMVP